MIDYCVMGSLLFFWDSACRFDDGSFCPFTAACTIFDPFVIMPVKDEIQCRVIWRKFISPLKLCSWPYEWKTSIHQVLVTAPFDFSSLLFLCLSGRTTFESILQPQVLLKVWLEVMGIVVITDAVMFFAHSWMHEKAYFFHKKHHHSGADLVSFLFPQADLLDALFEFGAGIPLLLAFKKTLGLDPRIHLLTHHAFLLSGFQNHSGNPYAVYFFIPFF